VAPGWPLRDPAAAEAELVRLAAVHGGSGITSLTGSAATEGAIRERLGTAALLHFAMPFRINAASPLFSPLLTSIAARSPVQPAPDNAEDGAIELREVVDMAVRARVVVLSDGAA
jgi:hypothetical protein